MRPSDIRQAPRDGDIVWRDGTCLACGAPTYATDSSHAPDPSEATHTDYYVWCSHAACRHYVGACVGDMECPPAWANHERT